MTPSTEQSTPGDHLPTALSCKYSGPYLSPAINLSLCFNTNSHNGKPLLSCMHQEKLSAKKSVSEDGMCFALFVGNVSIHCRYVCGGLLIFNLAGLRDTLKANLQVCL